MNFPPLTVIEASAGTGKTFSLVTRLLLLIFNGTPPERIVALTFSRLAAGEIFNSFIERLSKAAASETTAAEESRRLQEALHLEKPLTTSDFAAKLREVIGHQHLSLIGTLDSFLMRIVRMIPLELGLEGEVSIMSDYRSPVERLRLVGEMLMRETDDAKAIFREAFRLALGSAGAKGFLSGFSTFIAGWHQRYRDAYEQAGAAGLSADACLSRLVAGWGDASRIWGTNVPDGLDVTLAEIRAQADALATHAGKRGADTFIAAVRDFSGAVPKVPKCLETDPTATAAVAKMRAWKIAQALSATRGIFLLMHAYEAAYGASVRARGLITFDDMPRLLNALPPGVRLPLEYRMDAQFDHWALDEFQDTSGGQWRALKNLIDEASHPDAEKSVFIVGDRKQSIYEWRGGDVEILGGQVERAKDPANRLEALDESRRYVSVISDAVNQVFGEDVVRGLLDMDTAPASAQWKCRTHTSHDTTSPGFVEVVQAKKAGKQAAVSDFFEPIEHALAAVRPWERGIATAILVRKNGQGEAILAYLKSKGVTQVVFEGESNIADSPVLMVFTELVQLAEHADDTFAYAHIRTSPVAAALYPDGLPAPAELSARLLDDFTRLGMVRKFRAVREALKAVPDSWNAFTESRFEDFIKCVAEFEEVRDETMRLSDFAAFLEHKTRRDFAEPGMVRIMTMHQSKGLGFDWVILPLYEPESLRSERHVGPLEQDAPAWVLVNPGSAVDAGDPVLAVAERTRQQVQVYNALCLDYVAMTRAKRALTLILNPENAKPPTNPEKFSDLVRKVGLATAGDPAWYRCMKPMTVKPVERSCTTIVRGPRQTMRKSRPSESYYTGLCASSLFEADFGAAARRGTDLHAQYAQIEWLEPSAPQDETGRRILASDWAEVFVKPSADAQVWRERTYELCADGIWESGQFDRVVFTGTGASRRAVIYDFKTNAPRPKESAADFAQRLRETYAGQLASYRRALAKLTGIPSENIACVLLSTVGMDMIYSKANAK